MHGSRFASNLGALLLGGFLVISAFAFGWRTAGWLALGCGCAVAILVLVAFAFPARGGFHRCLDLLTVTAAVWTVVASRVFGGAGTIKWLSFADGAMLCGLACIGLFAHEVLVEREFRKLADSHRDALAAQAPIGDLRAA